MSPCEWGLCIDSRGTGYHPAVVKRAQKWAFTVLMDPNHRLRFQFSISHPGMHFNLISGEDTEALSVALSLSAKRLPRWNVIAPSKELSALGRGSGLLEQRTGPFA